MSAFAAAGNQCVDVFVVSDVPAPLVRQAQALVPEVDVRNLSLVNAYLLVLEQTQLVSESSTALTRETGRRLVETYSERYELPTKDSELKTFYLNALHSLYSRLAWEWKRKEVETLSGEKLSGFSLHVAESIMDSYFPLGGMGSDSVKAHHVRDALERRPWDQYPWVEAFKIVRAWEQAPEFERGFFYFYRWLGTQSHLPELAHADLERLFLAISGGYKKSSPVLCCKSSFACAVCPHNRKWLKTDRELTFLFYNNVVV